jgi:hypothetical protein
MGWLSSGSRSWLSCCSKLISQKHKSETCLEEDTNNVTSPFLPADLTHFIHPRTETVNRSSIQERPGGCRITLKTTGLVDIIWQQTIVEWGSGKNHPQSTPSCPVDTGRVQILLARHFSENYNVISVDLKLTQNHPVDAFTMTLSIWHQLSSKISTL